MSRYLLAKSQKGKFFKMKKKKERKEKPGNCVRVRENMHSLSKNCDCSYSIMYF